MNRKTLIWAALTAATAMLTGLSYFLISSGLGMETLPLQSAWEVHRQIVLPLGALALGAWILSLSLKNPQNPLAKAIYNQRLKPGFDRAEQAVFSIFVVRMALLEAMAVLAFVLSFQTKSHLGLPLSILALLTALSLRPRTAETR
jgi:hypothetical protein